MTVPVRCRGRDCATTLLPEAAASLGGLCLPCIRALRLKSQRRLLEHPATRALRHALAGLTISADCTNALVLDGRSTVLCEAHESSDAALEQVVSVTTSALRVLKPSLLRGGKLDRVWRLHLTAYLRSFGGAYVLFLHFSGAIDADRTRQIIAAELPAIASLTDGLPPPGGSGPASGEAFGTA